MKWFYLFSAESATKRSRDLFAASAFAVLVTSLILTLLVYFYFREHQKTYAAAAFEAESRRVAGVVEERYKLYVDMLLSLQGFFAASDKVEEDEWDAFVSKLRLGREHGGIKAVRYFEVAPDGAYRPVYQTLIDKDSPRPDFAADPTGVQQKAVELARDTDRSAMTSVMRFHGKEAMSGFLIVMPVFKNGKPLDTVENRRAALVGFIDAVCYSPDFFKKLMGGTSLKNITLQVHDGDDLLADHGDASLLYETPPAVLPGEEALKADIPMSLAGRVWRAHFRAKPSYGLGSLERRFSTIILFVGGLFSLLMFGILLIFSASRKQAVDIARDITQDLRKLAAIVEQSDDAIISETIDGVITSWNKGAEKMYGWTAAEAIGRSIHILFPEALKPELADILGRVQRGHYLQHYHTLRVRKDGSEIYVSLTVSPIRNARGEVTNASVIARDVTESRNAESALDKIRREHKAILDNIPDIAWLKDTNSTYIAVNEVYAKAAGALVEDMVGKNDFDYCPKDLAEKYRADDREVERSRARKKIEEEFQDKDGNRTWLETVKTPIYAADGTVIGTAGIARDITERRRLESQLLQSQKMDMIGTLAGGIAHDLNNQLTPVIGYIDLLLKQLEADRASTELLEDAKSAAARCVDVVERLMGFSHTTTQSIAILSPPHVLGELKKLISRVFPSTIAIESDCPAGVSAVRANETELQTVFMNLATNAKDAMPGGGKLRITAADVPARGDRGAEVLFTFKDNGAGISPQNLSRIFEPFFTTKQKGHGTGLGLAMVFSIVKKYDGRIEVDSQPGGGTEFRIFMPAQTGTAPSPAEDAGRPALMPKGTETVLLVDDEENLRKLGRMFLERLGYKVVTASDGEEAVKIYREKTKEIAAVVMDITMPRLSGSQALQEMRLLNPQAKVILVSGYTSEGSSKDFIAQGASSFLQKPYTIMPLAQTLRRVLDGPPGDVRP
jgi:PAS domain S-box-containing protein